MRIPYIINLNTKIEYDASEITKQLLHEVGRRLKSEDLDVDKPPYTLVVQCLNCIAKNFEQYPIINDLLLCSDRDYLLETLPCDLSLALVVPLIDDEIYWKRRYTDAYGVLYQHQHIGWTWKCIYLENYMADLVESAHPETNDEENMEDITTLLNPYIHRMVVTQLQSWQPPLSLEKSEIPDVYPSDHINIEPIFRRLVNIEELELMYGARNVGEKFNWTMFEVSMDDMRHLGKALVNLKKLRTFRLHNSTLEDAHIQILIKDLIKVTTLEELNISNCLIGDRGALCIAKMMMAHETLTKLVLANNKIGAKGGEGFGYALMQESCCPIKHLNLRLNPLGHQGVMGIFRALVRVQRLEELIISGCGFGDETAIRLGAVLQLHQVMKNIDVSNNWCLPGEKNILEGLMLNNKLQWLDLRETDISKEILTKINKKLLRNRKGDEGIEEEEEQEEEAEEEEEEILASVIGEAEEEEEEDAQDETPKAVLKPKASIEEELEEDENKAKEES